jgi:hypothetical protein
MNIKIDWKRRGDDDDDADDGKHIGSKAINKIKAAIARHWRIGGLYPNKCVV